MAEIPTLFNRVDISTTLRHFSDDVVCFSGFCFCFVLFCFFQLWSVLLLSFAELSLVVTRSDIQDTDTRHHLCASILFLFIVSFFFRVYLYVGVGATTGLFLLFPNKGVFTLLLSRAGLFLIG